MEPKSAKALKELREWCKKYDASLEVSEDHKRRISIRIRSTEETFNVGMFDSIRGSVIAESYESF